MFIVVLRTWRGLEVRYCCLTKVDIKSLSCTKRPSSPYSNLALLIHGTKRSVPSARTGGILQRLILISLVVWHQQLTATIVLVNPVCLYESRETSFPSCNPLGKPCLLGSKRKKTATKQLIEVHAYYGFLLSWPTQFHLVERSSRYLRNSCWGRGRQGPCCGIRERPGHGYKQVVSRRTVSRRSKSTKHHQLGSIAVSTIAINCYVARPRSACFTTPGHGVHDKVYMYSTYEYEEAKLPTLGLWRLSQAW